MPAASSRTWREEKRGTYHSSGNYSPGSQRGDLDPTSNYVEIVVDEATRGRLSPTVSVSPVNSINYSTFITRHITAAI
jgi:hypothetical protein